MLQLITELLFLLLWSSEGLRTVSRPVLPSSRIQEVWRNRRLWGENRAVRLLPTPGGIVRLPLSSGSIPYGTLSCKRTSSTILSTISTWYDRHGKMLGSCERLLACLLTRDC